MDQYGNKEYWDDRYKLDTQPFEWYQDYSALKPLLSKELQKLQTPSPRILVIGCGNSRLSEQLHNDCHRQIINIDISSVCINQMKEKYTDYKGMEFLEMDVTNMNFESNSFDMVIDKGTIDSLLCSKSASESCVKAVREVRRVLKSSGVFFCVSYGPPEFRLNYFSAEECRWSVDVGQLEKPGEEEDGDGEDKQFHYVYVCKSVGQEGN